MEENKISPADIAQWMLKEFEQSERLVQCLAAYQIRDMFGEEYVYQNENHNWAIKKEILEEFRNLTRDSVVWSRSEQLWRKRREYDPPGKRMVK